MSTSINFNNKLCYFLLTGGSKGIGQTIAIESAKSFKEGSVVVLLARTLSGLEATKAEILKLNPGVNVYVQSLDLSKPSAEQLNSIIRETYKSDINYDLAVIVHNVGTIGDASKKAVEVESYDELQDYYSINVFGPIVLNTQFMKIIKPDTKKLIINITSRAGIYPFPSLSFYCSGKAARELYFRVLAEEEKEKNTVLLNYSPGPVETDMTVYIQKEACVEGTRQYFEDLRAKQTILTTKQTTLKLLQVLEKGTFQTGDHVDFYDQI